MDFTWSGEQKVVYERMRAVGAAVEAMLPEARLEGLAKEGVLGLALPRDVGGGGLDLITTARAFEGLGATLSDGGLLLAAGAHLFGVALMIDRIGSPEQRAHWLPRLATGEWLATVAATELESGSDIASAGAIVKPAPGGFSISGHKRYVTMADRADVFFAVGRDGEAGRGLTALLIPRENKGIRVGAPLETAGLRGARLAPIELDDARTTELGLLGRPGAGLAVFQTAMTFERALVLAFRLGAMDTALAAAVRFARTRNVGGVVIAKHQAVAHRVARMKLRLETSRLLTYQACCALDRGERAQSEAALAKWHLADAAVESAIDAFRLRGGEAFLEESRLTTETIDALGGTIHSGTSDVLPTIVARWLGL